LNTAIPPDGVFECTGNMQKYQSGNTPDCNDMPLLDQVHPPLTTVRIQHYQMGYTSARLLLDALHDSPGSQDVTVMLPPQLMVRASTAPPV
jgi:DNA-binding LacI/PurR family transcriptional regulator